MSVDLTMELEPIFVRDEAVDPLPEFVRTGRSRLVIEGSDALVLALFEQAALCAEHLEGLDHSFAAVGS